MPQVQLPIFPEGVTQITDLLAFKKENGEVVYFNGLMPIFAHCEQDVRSFRIITSFFLVKGFVQQSDLCRTFGVTPIAVKKGGQEISRGGSTPSAVYAVRRCCFLMCWTRTYWQRAFG
jgi:hypothetical protein